MTEQLIREIFGKSIWDMTTQELIRYKLDEVWVQLVDEEV